MKEKIFPSIYPNIQYKNCPNAITWLESILGFELQMIHQEQNGRVLYAELKFGNGLVMVSSTDEEGYDWLGNEIGYQNISIFAGEREKVDEIHNRVKQDGSEIVKELQDSDWGEYGGSYGFTCLDQEGNRWSIGTYQPFARDI